MPRNYFKYKLKFALVTTKVDTFEVELVTFEDFVIDFTPLDKYKMPESELQEIEELLGDIVSTLFGFDGADRLTGLEELGAISLSA